MNQPSPIDRLIRVRRIRARLAMAALGRTQARRLADAALLSRVTDLLGAGGPHCGVEAASAAKARAGADALLARLGDDIRQRVAHGDADQARLGEALQRAQAAVDAAIARRTARTAEAEA